MRTLLALSGCITALPAFADLIVTNGLLIDRYTNNGNL